MLIEYLNTYRGERFKSVNGNDYHFKHVDGTLICDISDADSSVFLSHNDLFVKAKQKAVSNDVSEAKKLSDIDINDLDAVIAFANVVKGEIIYTRRNKRENILEELVRDGY
jgi:cbb3-type cytochrome oxidase cytochrome c subunit